MNNTYWSILLTILLCLSAKAQTSDITLTVLSEKESEPLFGANVFIKALEKGGVTNFDGQVTITDIPDGTHELLISYVGYETLKTPITTPTNQILTYSLEGGHGDLEEIVLQSTRSTRTIKNIPTRVELIGGEELGEKNIMNPTNISMVLRESTGIQMQQTSLSSGNSNIRIQGLDGRYTQLLRDGFPLYSGFSSGLSVLQIPPLDLQQFEIIKGSSSTLYGGGAIAGLVNMISKTPDYDPTLDIMLTQTQALGSTANVFYSKRNEKYGISLYASGHLQEAYDPEDDGFSNLPETRSLSFNPKFYYYPNEDTTFWVGINGTLDDRLGGDMDLIANGANGIHQYTEQNKSERLSSQALYETKIDANSLIKVKNSFSFFNRQLTVPDFRFEGEQFNSFTELTYDVTGDKNDWVFGGNLYTSSFQEASTTPIERDQDDVTVGVFANTIYDLTPQWILEAGLRADYNRDYGFFPLPRVSLLYKNDHGFSTRLGGGLGYKIPDIFTEEAEYINFENVLAIDRDAVDAERSYGVNFDVNYKTNLTEELKLSFNQLFYLTSIEKGLLLDPTDQGFFAYRNANDNILSRGAETNIKFSYHHWRWFLNYAFIDTQLNYLSGNPQKPLTAKHNAGSVIMYEGAKWRFGLETYYTGEQLLSNGTTTTDFITMGFLAMRNFDYFTLFANFENFTDRRQSRFSPLVLPPHQNPEFPEIYAPTDGFIFSVGVIIRPFGNEVEEHH